jgi:hypothetical protein
MEIKNRWTRQVIWENKGLETLREANLYGADLYGADLYGADLYGANLYGANLYGANLNGANLYGANLNVSVPPFSSHDFWAELLRQPAEEDLHRRMVVGMILISRDWCWPRMISLMTGDLATDWQEWVGPVFWKWPEECAHVGIPEVK